MRLVGHPAAGPLPPTSCHLNPTSPPPTLHTPRKQLWPPPHPPQQVQLAVLAHCDEGGAVAADDRVVQPLLLAYRAQQAALHAEDVQRKVVPRSQELAAVGEPGAGGDLRQAGGGGPERCGTRSLLELRCALGPPALRLCRPCSAAAL